jgi:hypothetical protein
MMKERIKCLALSGGVLSPLGTNDLQDFQSLNSAIYRACCKTRLVLHRPLQFFALRATKLHFSAVAVAKLKFCNCLYIYF